MRKAVGPGGHLGQLGELRRAEATSTAPVRWVEPALSWEGRQGPAVVVSATLHLCNAPWVICCVNLCFLSPCDVDRFSHSHGPALLSWSL